MKTLKFLKLFSLIFCFSLFVTSCQDDAIEVLTDEDKVTAMDDTELTAEYDNLETMSEDVMVDLSGGRVTGTDSSTICDRSVVTHDRDNKTIVIDFGTEGCTGPGGRLRTGKVTIVYTGEFGRDYRGQRTLTFENYAIDGRGVDGTLVIGAWAKNNADNWESTLTASTMVFSFLDGTTFEVTSGTRTREIIQGTLGLPIAFRITGNSTGVNRNGRGFTTQIADTEPITFSRSCLRTGNPYPVSGRRGIKIEGRPLFKIDFGNGTCDRLAIIQIGDGEPFPITLGQ